MLISKCVHFRCEFCRHIWVLIIFVFIRLENGSFVIMWILRFQVSKNWIALIKRAFLRKKAEVPALINNLVKTNKEQSQLNLHGTKWLYHVNMRYLSRFFWLLSASKPKCKFGHRSKMSFKSSSYLLPKSTINHGTKGPFFQKIWWGSKRYAKSLS